MMKAAPAVMGQTGHTFRYRIVGAVMGAVAGHGGIDRKLAGGRGSSPAIITTAPSPTSATTDFLSYYSSYDDGRHGSWIGRSRSPSPRTRVPPPPPPDNRASHLPSETATRLLAPETSNISNIRSNNYDFNSQILQDLQPQQPPPPLPPPPPAFLLNYDRTNYFHSNNNNDNDNNNNSSNNNHKNRDKSQGKHIHYQDLEQNLDSTQKANHSYNSENNQNTLSDKRESREKPRNHHRSHYNKHLVRPHFNSVVYQPSSGERPFWHYIPSKESMADQSEHAFVASSSLRPGDQPVAIDIEAPSSPSRNNSETSSMSSQMISALRHRARRLTASANYQDQNEMIGAEPGVDLKQEIDVDLYADCGITVVDFDKETLTQTELNNLSLPEFLNHPRPSWSKVRWINVNGLSFDVIKALGQYKALHRLAIEDLMNTKNRAKCDWYSDHTFIIVTLQKLVNIHQAVSKDELKKRRSFWAKLGGFRAPEADSEEEEEEARDDMNDYDDSETRLLKSLQRYHGGPNSERIVYMERHSSLVEKNLFVSVEQVGIFLTDDNIVISFFENSADDIEPPILARLQSTNTLLRSAEDASMVLQAILDAIIDLSFPIVHAYQDTIGDLELHVLTEPSLEHTSALYIITSELSLLKTTLQPLVTVISALRDHIKDHHYRKSNDVNGSFLTSVEVSSITHTYLGDVQDHCVMLLEYVDTMKRSADNLTDLLFNIISNFQNESMRTLTLVTVLFLPMSFLTGYFGMNLTTFPSVDNSETYFWQIGVPVAVATMIFLMFDSIKRFFVLIFRKRQIKKVRKMRLAKAVIDKARFKRRETNRTNMSSRRSGDMGGPRPSVVISPPSTSAQKEKASALGAQGAGETSKKEQ